MRTDPPRLSPTSSADDPIVVAGKAILLGEHFVVYGVPALALSIPKAVQVDAEPHAHVQLDIPQWNLALLPDAQGSDLARAFHALLQRLPHAAPALRLRATLSLPSGVGLGSSASLGVAVLCALERHAPWQLTAQQRYEIMFAWEGVFHGEPSGFDHATAMHDGLTYFERFATPPIRALACPRPLELIIAQIDEGASTRTMVEGVAAWRKAHPAAFEEILQRARARVDAFLTALNNPALLSEEFLRAAGKLIQQNQQDLRLVGVSTSNLDAACDAAENAGAYGAKLIGAGGGGCILALVDPTISDRVLTTLQAHSQRCFPLSLSDEVSL